MAPRRGGLEGPNAVPSSPGGCKDNKLFRKRLPPRLCWQEARPRLAMLPASHSMHTYAHRQVCVIVRECRMCVCVCVFVCLCLCVTWTEPGLLFIDLSRFLRQLCPGLQGHGAPHAESWQA